MISTPCYGGMCHALHMQSCLKLAEALIEAGIDYQFSHPINESLIQRARNSEAAAFLKTDLEKLLFIDSDIQFEPQAVADLWNLQTDIAVALYRMKRLDAPLAAWVDGKMIEKDDFPKLRFEVDYAGTGFMMIDRKVFENMKKEFPEREHVEGTGQSFAWFDPRVHDGFYISEDYAFCHDARSIGYKVIAEPGIHLIHHGTHGYG